MHNIHLSSTYVVPSDNLQINRLSKNHIVAAITTRPQVSVIVKQEIPFVMQNFLIDALSPKHAKYKTGRKNRQRVFEKVSDLLNEINKRIIYQNIKFEIRSEYAIEYLEQVTAKYIKVANIDIKNTVKGRGHRKTDEQRIYEKLVKYTEKLKKYATHIKVCGEERNSYSKTDHDATFMRMKRDYIGNEQLLPGYNIQLGLCDEYIAVYDVKQYASDMDCFQPLVEKFHDIYGEYPEYPVADAGYGSFNNYLYCEEHGIKKTHEIYYVQKGMRRLYKLSTKRKML